MGVISSLFNKVAVLNAGTVKSIDSTSQLVSSAVQSSVKVSAVTLAVSAAKAPSTPAPATLAATAIQISQTTATKIAQVIKTRDVALSQSLLDYNYAVDYRNGLISSKNQVNDLLIATQTAAVNGQVDACIRAQSTIQDMITGVTNVTTRIVALLIDIRQKMISVSSVGYDITKESQLIFQENAIASFANEANDIVGYVKKAKDTCDGYVVAATQKEQRNIQTAQEVLLDGVVIKGAAQLGIPTEVSTEAKISDFIHNAPNLLFVCEYIVDGNKLGYLVAWEKYTNANYYEVYKRNLTNHDSNFYRLLVLDSTNLKKETNYYESWVKDNLNFDFVPGTVFIIFDDEIEEDFIYEYKIRGINYPTVANEVSYAHALEGKGLLKSANILKTSTKTIFDVASDLYSTSTINNVDSKAWAVSVLNSNLNYFGPGALSSPVASNLFGQSASSNYVICYTTLTPDDIRSVIEIFSETLKIFGRDIAVKRFLDLVGGLDTVFSNAFIGAVDSASYMFVYSTFLGIVEINYPYLTKAFDITNSTQVQEVASFSDVDNAILAKNPDSLLSVDGISRILKIVNLVYLIAISSVGIDNYANYNKYINMLSEALKETAIPAASNVGTVYTSPQVVSSQETTQIVGNATTNNGTPTSSGLISIK